MNQSLHNSYLWGNLAICPSHYAVIQSSSYPVVKILDRATVKNMEKPMPVNSEKPILEMGFVSDIKYVYLNNNWTLVACSNTNVFAFSATGTNMTKIGMDEKSDTNYGVNKSPNEAISNVQAVMYTGIASINNTLYIGDCNGNIHCIELKNTDNSELTAENISNKYIMLNIGEPVTALEACGKNLYAGTDSGVLAVINCEKRQVTCKQTTPQKNGMITKLSKMDNRYILGAQTNGGIFIYSIEESKILTSMVNHSKETTCIDGIKNKSGDGYLIASGSDDGIQVVMNWKPDSGDIEVQICKNQNERAILGVCINHTHVVATLYNDCNTFVFHF